MLSDFIDAVLDEIWDPLRNPQGGLFVIKDCDDKQYIIDSLGHLVLDEHGFYCDCCGQPCSLS